jgi:hypothetical protein
MVAQLPIRERNTEMVSQGVGRRGDKENSNLSSLYSSLPTGRTPKN